MIVIEHGQADRAATRPASTPDWAIQNDVHPQHRPMLRDYYARTLRDACGKHSRALPAEALSWHHGFIDTGSTRAN